MGVFDLYSKRKKRELGEQPDVFTYDEIPQELKVQVTHMWDDAIGDKDDYFEEYGRDGGKTKSMYKFIVETLRREYGMYRLSESYTDNTYRGELRKFFVTTDNTDRALDVIELSFRAIDKVCREWSSDRRRASEDVIEELDKRFIEHGVGYGYAEGIIIKRDTELTHKEIVKPALYFLSQEGYAGAREEFLTAFEHQRNGANKEALNDCLKAFESTMKAICDKRGWAYSKNATAKPLIAIMFDNGLVPSFWQNQFNSLRSLLESSVPTGRNKQSGHGQGNERIVVSDEVVQFMLNMTASCILFLAKAEKK